MAYKEHTAFLDGYLEDIYLSEKEKQSEDYLRDNANYLILNLVREKREIKKYRNYYNGVRDEKEFEYLTTNFGIGTPSKLKFVNIIKPRIDALASKMIDESFEYKVSCIDDKTISKIEDTRKNQLLQAKMNLIDTFIRNKIQAVQNETKAMSIQDLDRSLNRIVTKFTDSFRSDFEIAAQDLLKYFETDPVLDLLQKFAIMVHDFLVTGECYYRVYCDIIGNDPILEVVKPENIFFNKNTNTPYLDMIDGVVHREYMTRKEVLYKYGKFMSEEDIKQVFGEGGRIRSARALRTGVDLERYYQAEDPVYGQKSYSNLDVVEVFHCEWTALNEFDLDPEDQLDNTQVEGPEGKVRKVSYRKDRYEATRIAGTIFLNAGKSRHINRSETNPYDCGLTYGGTLYNDRNGKPYSIVAALKDIQDVYDLTIFFRDNMLANSGVQGNRVNLAGIPKALGSNFMERLFKFMALKKQGIELIDPTEPGAQLFQHYGDFDNSLSSNSIAAIENILNMIERQADIIAGTNPQMLGQIAERDAVGNVKQGIRQSLLINEGMFDLIRNTYKQVLTRLLNTAKLTFIKGKKASYITGSESHVFEIIPTNFCFSDYMINISYGSKDSVKLQELKLVAKELIAGGMLDPDTIIFIILSDSVTEVKNIINSAWKKKKEENDIVGQSQQQVEQLEKQLQDLTNEFSKTQSQLKSNQQKADAIRQAELDLKRQETLANIDLNTKKLDYDKEFDDASINVKKELVTLEREQLYLSAQGGGNAAEPKNVV